MISNCSSAGADSMANPITGVVTRKDPLTGATIPANIRPTSGQTAQPTTPPPAEASLSSSALSVLLSFQQA